LTIVNGTSWEVAEVTPGVQITPSVPPRHGIPPTGVAFVTTLSGVVMLNVPPWIAAFEPPAHETVAR
jgi:hypothetical protein